MNYDEALEYIHSPRYSNIELGLENIRSLMNALDHPQKRLKFVHIAGTNGKGSVASYLSHILRKAGYKTGLFTSPYIQRFNERIRVNGQNIPDHSLAKITEIVKRKVEKYNINTTEFELMTAIALLYFKEQDCDIVVLEVGLGGRLDSTNVIEEPLLSIITSISYDHQAYLGSTLGEIATEKAGIIKKNRPVLLYSQEEEAENAVLRVAKDRNSPIYQPDFAQIKNVESNLTGQQFHYKAYDDLKIRLLGDHQLKNASIAIEAVHLLNKQGLEIDESALRKGLVDTTWPGRFEIIHHKPVVIIDGAHNIDSINTLVDNLTKYFPDKKIFAIFGMLKDKDVDQIIVKVIPIIDQVITVTPNNPRAVNAGDLAEKIKRKSGQARSSQSFEDAIELALKEVGDDDIICCFGSLYYIGEIRRIFSEKKFARKK